MTPKPLLDLLAEQAKSHSVDHDTLTATIPSWKEEISHRPLENSQVGYICCRTLHSLATAEEDTLFDIYGSSITRWPGSVTARQDPHKGLQEERDWVAQHRAQTPNATLSAIISDIRLALASVHLVKVDDLDKFASVCPGSEDLSTAVALHRRLGDSHEIYILPFLPRIEDLVKNEVIDAAPNGGRGLDVLAIAAAKTMIHETRHIVAAVLHGTAALTNADKCGEWYELSRYGASGDTTILSSTSAIEPRDTRICFTGRIGGGPLRLLLPDRVQQLAKKARSGTFLGVEQFFTQNSTLHVSDYFLTLADVDPETSETTSPSQTHSRKSNTGSLSAQLQLQHQGPLVVNARPVSGLLPGQSSGYRSYHGVLR